MADINRHLKAIRDAVLGEEVRSSIHDALAAMNEESSDARTQAITSQQSALNSANAAAESETNAKASEIAAKSSEDAAAASETNAKASETAAATSETNAKASENAAAASETNAKASENAAATSETNAKASETAAATSERNANDSELAAATSERNSGISETNAKASETAAATSETNAKASETAAATSETNAKASENAAAESETNAKASETNAKASETAAAQSASDAETSANTAKAHSGNPAKPIDGTWWIWNAETGAYEDSGIGCELVGPQGVGVSDIQLTSGNHSPGSTDVYTLTLTDGSTFSLSVYNGRNGTGAGDMLGIQIDFVLPADGWTDGSINIYDNRFLASSAHKYLLYVAEEDKLEYAVRDIQPKDITIDGVMTFTCGAPLTKDLSISILRLELGVNAE